MLNLDLLKEIIEAEREIKFIIDSYEQAKMEHTTKSEFIKSYAKQLGEMRCEQKLNNIG